MPKKKVSVKKKVVSSKSLIVSGKKADKCCSSWIWWVLGALILLAALFFLYKGMTGNVITGEVVSTEDAFKPIVQMVAGFIKAVYSAIEEPLNFVVGDTTGVGGIDDAGIFLAKVLLLLLVFSLVSAILSSSGISFLVDGWTHWITSVVVAILGVRYLSSDLISTILMPYSTFGVVISAALPFVLYFFFVEKSLGAPKAPIFRKVAWIFFAVVFLAIWIMRQEVSESTNPIISTIYPLTALLSVLMAIFDGTLQKLFNSARRARRKEATNSALIGRMTHLQNQKKVEFDTAMSAGTLPGGYRGGSLIGIIPKQYAPSEASDNGQAAYEKDDLAISKYISSIV